MRILKHPLRFMGWFLVATILPILSLNAQEKSSVVLKAFLNKATEEIPKKATPIPVKRNKPSDPEFRAILENVTEEIPDQPKPRFVSSRHFSNEKLKIQLGYFKEKKNVNKMVKRIKSKHDWPVYVKTENKNGTDYYRVLIVDISSRRTANAIVGQLKSEGLKGYIK